MSRRKVKNVSFADSDYEQGLLAHATQPEHGPFSQYVKRLIEADRKGALGMSIGGATSTHTAPVPESHIVSPPSNTMPNRPPVPRPTAPSNDDRRAAARSFFT